MHLVGQPGSSGFFLYQSVCVCCLLEGSRVDGRV